MEYVCTARGIDRISQCNAYSAVISIVAENWHLSLTVIRFRAYIEYINPREKPQPVLFQQWLLNSLIRPIGSPI